MHAHVVKLSSDDNKVSCCAFCLNALVLEEVVWCTPLEVIHNSQNHGTLWICALLNLTNLPYRRRTRFSFRSADPTTQSPPAIMGRALRRGMRYQKLKCVRLRYNN